MRKYSWKPEDIEKLRELRLAGFSLSEIAASMTAQLGRPITYGMVEVMRRRSGLPVLAVQADPNVKTYVIDVLPLDDYMVSCDYHAPFHSPWWINKMLEVAERFKIKKHIIAGDFFDFEFASKWPGDHGTLDAEVDGSKEALKAIDAFDVNYFIQGNHERRVQRLTDGKITAQHLFSLFGKERWENRVRYMTNDSVRVGDDYLILHPSSYSQISGSVAVRLAEKHHRHVLNAHGHFAAIRYDKSGKYVCVDLGGMFDIQRIEYCMTRSTTHPYWNNGFGMIRDGRFTLFHPQTDWKIWTK